MTEKKRIEQEKINKADKKKTDKQRPHATSADGWSEKIFTTASVQQ